MQTTKETVSNIAASAKSGMDKTKATAQEKTRQHNAAAHNMGGATGGTVGGLHGTTTGHSTGTNQMSAVPGHGTGAPAGGHVTEGTVGTHPTGTNTGVNSRTGGACS
ncbi:hypothetical protein AQUCO_00600355v1 [Aquilegia coerulea]|uniref:Uncharacterized protein n=1 Tax=Aquilegia coerulea TaxID=218851 RepID=A0A2G5EPD2_AQUCA|nr:hypothetical protein AQUCO_00600355v1 [Aquilegia coerulea]